MYIIIAIIQTECEICSVSRMLKLIYHNLLLKEMYGKL